MQIYEVNKLIFKYIADKKLSVPNRFLSVTVGRSRIATKKPAVVAGSL